MPDPHKPDVAKPDVVPTPAPAVPDLGVPALIRELDKVDDLDSWRVLVGFGLDRLLASDPGTVLDIFTRRASRATADDRLSRMSVGARIHYLLGLFDLKLIVTRRREKGAS